MARRLLLALVPAVVLTLLPCRAVAGQQGARVALVYRAPTGATWSSSTIAPTWPVARLAASTGRPDTTAAARERRQSKFAIVGVLAGALVGGNIGFRSVEPVEDSFFGFEYVKPTVVGIVVGGAVGGFVAAALERVTRR